MTSAKNYRVGSAIRCLIQYKSMAYSCIFIQVSKFQDFRDVGYSTLKLSFFFCTKVYIYIYIYINNSICTYINNNKLFQAY